MVSLVDVPDFLLVNADMGVNSVPEFLAKARKMSATNSLNFGSAGTASTLHLDRRMAQSSSRPARHAYPIQAVVAPPWSRWPPVK